MRWPIAFLSAVILVAGCRPPEPVYAVRRSALVPHPLAPPRSGRPLEGRVQFAVQNSTVIQPVAPREATGANAGLYVARDNLGGAVRTRLSANLELSFQLEVALAAGAMPIAHDALPAPDNGNAYGGGLGMMYSIPMGREFHLGVAVDALRYLIPYHEEAVCIQNCELGGPDSYQETGTHRVTVLSYSLLPTWHRNGLTLWGSVTQRNHPTNTERESQTLSGNGRDDDDEVNFGPMYTIVGGGAELHLGGGVRAYAVLFVPLTERPVVYGPVIGFGLSVTFGRGSSVAASAPLPMAAPTEPAAPPMR